MLTGNAQPTDLVRRKAPQVVSALSGVPRAKASRRTVQGPSRGTFDRGDLKEVAGSIRYGATINFLCNESLAVGLRSLHETNSALRYVATRPEDITPALAVAGGHFVQVGLRPLMWSWLPVAIWRHLWSLAWRSKALPDSWR